VAIAFSSFWQHRSSDRVEADAVSAGLLATVYAHAVELEHRCGQPAPIGNDPLTGDWPQPAAAPTAAERLRTEVGRLPDAQRQVITLIVFGQLSAGEIASHLRLPRTTVTGRMRLGLQTLRDRADSASR
jgi:DNA-directed RNA polymerase specialized sigma24 family protein